MISNIISSNMLKIGSQIINKIIPDAKQRKDAELKLLRLEQKGELKEIEAAMTNILAEANSQDPWTSRARPSFLYVIYLMILSSIPIGVLYMVTPEAAENLTKGVTMWLAAVPDSLWTLFGVGYLGYTGARSWDKGKKTS